MKVFVAGATGALGKQLVPKLVGSGHDVWGTTRSESRPEVADERGRWSSTRSTPTRSAKP